MGDTIRYRSRAGECVRAEIRDDGLVRITYRPGSAEQARRIITREQLEDAVAVGELRSFAKR